MGRHARRARGPAAPSIRRASASIAAWSPSGRRSGRSRSRGRSGRGRSTPAALAAALRPSAAVALSTLTRDPRVLGELGDPLPLRLADDGIGDRDVVEARGGEHLRLADLGDRDAVGARLALEARRSPTLLCVLMCGRRRTPAASAACCQRAMLRSRRSRSTSSAGVSSVLTLVGRRAPERGRRAVHVTNVIWRLPNVNSLQRANSVAGPDRVDVELHPDGQAPVGDDQRTRDVARFRGQRGT